MSKAKNKWGAELSGFIFIECAGHCGEKWEVEVVDGKINVDGQFYFAAVPYNGDPEHLEPTCWDCAQAEYGEANRVKPRPTSKPKAQKRTVRP